MLQWFRVLFTLSKIQNLVPSPFSGGSQALVTPISGDMTPSSGLLMYSHAYVNAHTHTDTVLTKKIIIKIKHVTGYTSNGLSKINIILPNRTCYFH